METSPTGMEIIPTGEIAYDRVVSPEDQAAIEAKRDAVWQRQASGEPATEPQPPEETEATSE
jgi:hypothetical protein